jgi:hypothetical protein
VFDFNKAPSPHGLHHLCIEQRGQRHPARFRGGACGLFSGWLHPTAEMGHDSREVMRIAIAHKERYTARRQPYWP